MSAETAQKNARFGKKTAALCVAVVVWAGFAANYRRFSPPDPDCVRAVALYTEILQKADVVGADYSPLTTTLGSFAAKKSSAHPLAAALMVRLLKDAGASGGTVIAVNASGSFPGFVLATLAACAAMEIRASVVASVGASSYGANVPGNTIADILMKLDAPEPLWTLLAVTPGGSEDRGAEVDGEELARVAAMLEGRGIPFIRPASLRDAVAVRKTLFDRAGCALLVNIGGNHASDDLIRRFEAEGKPAIRVLNVKKLYAAYGLEFDEDGALVSSAEAVYRSGKIPPLLALPPVLVMLASLAVIRFQRVFKRRGERLVAP